MSAQLKSNIPQLVGRMRLRAKLLVRQTASDIVADTRTGMGGVKHGREYKRGGKTHRASAPGEAPAVETPEGGYAQTIRSAKVDDLTYSVGSDDPRGPALELGGAHVAARPHLGPAAERAREGFAEGLGEIFE